ncbi:MAG: trans-sulfuration enzyme family protein [Fibrobacterota bacterium]|nr:PLP-dependent aspartate aminotransferase family protein [Chitinispirillaceae bacterium]
MSLDVETRLVRAGIGTDPRTGALSTPIYQTATFAHPSLGMTSGYDYSRSGNPTRTVLEQVVADLEGGVRAFAFSSGMAAINAFLQLFKPGDTILTSEDLYGGTYRLFFDVFESWGLRFVQVDFSDSAALGAAVKLYSAKAVFVETPTNPLMRITDIKKVCQFSKKNHLLTIVDNTFMTPLCQRPLELGADVVIHSGTKFLSGHNDTLCGFIVVNNQDLAQRVAFIQNAAGAVLAPFDSWLVLRGLKTLALRMKASQQNAYKIARWLSGNSNVTDVYYPGLKSHEGYAIHARQSSGAGALIAFRVKNKQLVKKIINGVRVITFAESLGGVETLITYPYTQTHAAIPEAIRKKNGITENLLRMSIGIEYIDDLLSDLEKAIG